MDAIDSRNPTNFETKKKMVAKKILKQIMSYKTIKVCRTRPSKYVVQDHHLIKNTRMILLKKLTAREIYSVLLLLWGNTPNSQK